MDSNNQYPRFINNTPLGEDLFEGKSQQKIANNICKIIKTEDGCNIIGIDGGWGSGKSNLVKQVENILSVDGYHFFIYDAWGHQEDLQRRSFLEELTENLTGNILNKEEWGSKLKQLLSKTKETQSKRVPKLSFGVIMIALAILITPLFKSVADQLEKKGYVICAFLTLVIPILTLLGLYIYYLCQEKGEFKKRATRAFVKLFLEYQNKLEEETMYEMISEDEPSVRKFRTWMSDISKDLGNKNLILVFDNMDRLPKDKVQELWSSIHVFFCEHSYSNIKVIIPFDREHIKLAFSEENTNKQYGDDFINKSFNVVYRVSPPILSDWKNYFTKQWEEAFGKGNSLVNSNILQIFDLLSEGITPRRIIAFINEFVSIKLTVNDSIPNDYIALFIQGKHAISENPIDEIIHPTYLKGMGYLYENDEELPKFIAALFYQVEPEKAIQIVFTDRIKRVLNENMADELIKMSSIPEFYYILENAITDVSNYENAILALDKLPVDKIGNKYQAESIWNCLYKKTVPRGNSQISEFQLILLSRISKQKEYIHIILNDLVSDPKFSSANYFESINAIENKFKDKLSIFNELKPRKTSVEDFIDFIIKAKSGYAQYKITVNSKELNDYLIALEIPKLKELDFIPYLTTEYSFASFIVKLEELIRAHAPNNDKEAMGVLYQRYKEASILEPLKQKLEDSSVYSLFSNSTEKEDFYFDLIAMRIAKLDTFNADYTSLFDKILQSTEESLVSKVVNRIEYYITYGDILLGLEKFNYPLFNKIAQHLAIHPNDESMANISELIVKFQKICELAEVEPSDFLKSLNEWSQFLEKDVTINNIKEVASAFFFEHAIKEDITISRYCIGTASEYLNSLTEDSWKDVLKDLNSYEIQISLIINYKFSTNAFDAIKDILKSIASGSISVPNKNIMQEIILKLEEQGKSLKATFNTVRDSVCIANSMTIPLFKFIGDWLFKYADMENNQASLRTIFTADVIKDNECIEIILNHKEKMPFIINAAREEAQDFKESIKARLSNDQSLDFVDFSKSIGVEIDLKDEAPKEEL